MSYPQGEVYAVPDLYHRDYLELMAIEAHTLYAYWEIGNRKKTLAERHFKCDWNVLPKVLRVYDVTCIHFDGNNANRSFDVVTTPGADNWFITNVDTQTTYIIDLGVTTWEGQFVPLLRSRATTTPRDYPAGVGEPILPVMPDEQFRNKRIMPRTHENFHIHEEYAK